MNLIAKLRIGHDTVVKLKVREKKQIPILKRLTMKFI